MRTIVHFSILLCCLVVFALPPKAAAQHSFAHTVTVNLSGNGDETAIQAGINECESLGTPCTVLIYAGVYVTGTIPQPLIHLDGDQEGISIVGVDRESVIIEVDGAGSGIKITTGTESVRDNSIRNLTIRTENGHGIEIAKGTSVPKGITIDNVTIEADGTGKDGINAESPEQLTIKNCRISSASNHGIDLLRVDSTPPTTVHIEGSQISVSGTSVNAFRTDRVDGLFVTDSEFVSTNGTGIMIRGSENVKPENIRLIRVEAHGGSIFPGMTAFFPLGFELVDCNVSGGGIHGMWLQNPDQVLLADSNITGEQMGLEVNELGIDGPDRFRIVNCRITAVAEADLSFISAVRNDHGGDVLQDPIVIERSVLHAINDGATDAYAIFGDSGNVTLIDCTLIAENINDESTGGGAIALEHRRPAVFRMIGGSLSSSVANERQTEVYDIAITQDTPRTYLSNVEFSTWKGVILPEDRKSTRVQRMLTVNAASTTVIHDAITLTVSEQSITTGITNPDVYRALSITGTGSWTNSATVYIIEKSWAKTDITETITIPAESTDPSVNGFRPFKAVTKIIVPAAEVGQNQSISVGTTDKLGLYAPLSSNADVIEWATLQSGEYVVETGSLTVDVDFATVKPTSITTGDSFEFTYLTP